jgi:hypothetical protein
LTEIDSRADSISLTVQSAIFAKAYDKNGSLNQMEELGVVFCLVRLA